MQYRHGKHFRNKINSKFLLAIVCSLFLTCFHDIVRILDRIYHNFKFFFSTRRTIPQINIMLVHVMQLCVLNCLHYPFVFEEEYFANKKEMNVRNLSNHTQKL